MALRRVVKRAVQLFGYDIRRLDDRSDPTKRLPLLIHSHRVSTVIDVGANVGDYGAGLRREGFAGPIFSFEPVSEQWEALRDRAAPDDLWTPLHYALGDSTTEVTINVAMNKGASSSIMSMLPRHEQAAPEARFFRTERVSQHRLDEVASELGLDNHDRIFMKVDVQGYEDRVLAGAAQLIHRIIGIQIEMSFVPLYEGSMLFRQMLDWMEKHGFHLELMIPVFSDPSTGADLQVDGIFFRDRPV